MNAQVYLVLFPSNGDKPHYALMESSEAAHREGKAAMLKSLECMRFPAAPHYVCWERYEIEAAV